MYALWLRATESAVYIEEWLCKDGTVRFHIYCLSMASGLSLLSVQVKWFLILLNAPPCNFNRKALSQAILFFAHVSSLLMKTVRAKCNLGSLR